MKGALITEQMPFDKRSTKATGAKGVPENPALPDIIERRRRKKPKI